MPWTAPAAATAFLPADLSRFCAKFVKKLGEGAFGAVFAGTLPDGRRIAVKQMELLSKDKQKQQEAVAGRANPYAGEAGFRLELEVLSKYVHPNLVQLIGYCVEKQSWRKKSTTCSLVLEYMPGGSLLERLRPAPGAPAIGE